MAIFGSCSSPVILEWLRCFSEAVFSSRRVCIRVGADMALVSVRLARGRHCDCALGITGSEILLVVYPAWFCGVWRRGLGRPRDAECRGGRGVTLACYREEAEQSTQCVIRGRCLYCKPYRHMGKGWHVSRGCSKKWRLELGRGRRKRARPFPPSFSDSTLVRTRSHSLLEKAFILLTTGVGMNSAILTAPSTLCTDAKRGERLCLVAARPRPL